MSWRSRLTIGGVVVAVIGFAPVASMIYLGDPPAVEEAKRKRWAAAANRRRAQQEQETEGAANRIIEETDKHDQIFQVTAGHLKEATRARQEQSAWEKIRAENHKK